MKVTEIIKQNKESGEENEADEVIIETRKWWENMIWILYVLKNIQDFSTVFILVVKKDILVMNKQLTSDGLIVNK